MNNFTQRQNELNKRVDVAITRVLNDYSKRNITDCLKEIIKYGQFVKESARYAKVNSDYPESSYRSICSELNDVEELLNLIHRNKFTIGQDRFITEINQIADNLTTAITGNHAKV